MVLRLILGSTLLAIFVPMLEHQNKTKAKKKQKKNKKKKKKNKLTVRAEQCQRCHRKNGNFVNKKRFSERTRFIGYLKNITVKMNKMKSNC